MHIRLFNIVKVLIISATLGIAISYGPFYLFHGVLIYFFIMLFFWINQSKYKIKLPIVQPRYHYIFFFVFFWYMLSIFWSVYPAYSIIYIFYIFCGVTVSLAIVYFVNDILKLKSIFKVIALVFIIEILLSLLEVYTAFRFPISPFSPYAQYFLRAPGDFTAFSLEIQKYIESLPTGFRWNPNNLAATMCIVLPFFLFHKKNWVKYLGCISVLTIIHATDSRGGILAGLFIFVCYFLIYSRYYKKFLNSFIILFILWGGLSVFNIFENSIQNNIFTSIQESITATQVFLFNEIEPNASIGIRQRLIHNGFAALKGTYGLGVGGGGSMWIQESDPTLTISSMHNFWVELLVEGGVIFFVIFISWYMMLFLHLYRIYYNINNSDLEYFSGSCSLALLGFIPAAISPSGCIYLLPMWILFGFSVSTLVIAAKHRKADKISC